jgi:hypothetical protein
VLGGFWALRLRTGWVVVQQKVRYPPSSSFNCDRLFSDWPLVAVLLPRAPTLGQGK